MTTTTLEILPVTATIGAEVRGVERPDEAGELRGRNGPTPRNRNERRSARR